MPFAADSTLVGQIIPSPNHEPRRAAIDIVLLHYTGMPDTDAALARLSSQEAKVSSHYLVREDGAVVQLVAEARRAFHAGVSSWEATSDINSRSIGIEIAHGGHDAGCPDYPGIQIEAVIALCRDIVARHAIRADRVLAHSDVAPNRKNDPGEFFPWDRLARAGVGLWVEPSPIVAGEDFALGSTGEGVAMLQNALARYGYGLAASGVFDSDTQAVVIAFQRHFRPARVDGVADPSTRATLNALLAAQQRLAS